jgi:hypothetical protein
MSELTREPDSTGGKSKKKKQTMESLPIPLHSIPFHQISSIQTKP